MATERQQAANAANAQLSTGPTSANGKAVVAKNAVRHGVMCNTPVVPGEDPLAWEDHRAGVVESLQPVGLLELTLAEQAALLLWRMGRLARYEALSTAAGIEAVDVPAAVYEGGIKFDSDVFTGTLKENSTERAARESREKRWAKASLLLLSDDKQQKVIRYESHLSRHLQVTLDRLRILQANRSASPAPPPTTGHLTVHVEGTTGAGEV